MAKSMRKKEEAEFDAESQELMGVVQQLGAAIKTLQKNFESAELLQKSGKASKAAQNALLQTTQLVRGIAGKFSDRMAMDMADINSAFPLGETVEDMVGEAFDGVQAVHAGKVAAFVSQPAGYESYNARSGKILGVLKQMQEEMEGNLSDAQKAELDRKESFQKLKAAKQGEIDSATKQIEDKLGRLSQTKLDLANGREDLEDTNASLDADTKFMVDLTTRCENFESEYDERVSTRNEEMQAIGATIKILTDDDARDLMHKTIGSASFLQKGAVTRAVATAEKKLRQKLMSVLQSAYKKTQASTLMALAVSVQLDAFTKVKEAMDKMKKELQQEQKEEVEKKDYCIQELDVNDDEAREEQHVEKGTQSKIDQLEASIDTLKEEIVEFEKIVASTQVSIKRAGEDRAAQNKQFQQVVADQRATKAILEKAIKKLNSVYAKKSLLQEGAPGEANKEAPGNFKSYKKQGASSGVVSMIRSIIHDADLEEQETVHDEKTQQTQYEAFLKDSFEAIARAQRGITDRKQEKAADRAALTAANADLLQTTANINSLKKARVDLHGECDFILQNFDARQASRQGEMDAIDEAKAILSGANFGES